MFFTYLDQVMSPGVDYHLTISKTDDGKLVVIVLPKVNGLKDPAQHRIGPLNLSGTPQELDGGFFPAITQPIRKASGLLVDMANYEKTLDEAAKESKAAKDQKEKQSKETKEKKDKYDGFIKKAEEMEAAGNLDGAITQLQQARLHATEKNTKTVDEKIAAIKANMGQGSLFEVAPVPAQAPTPILAPAPAAPQTPAASATEAVPAPNPVAAQPAAVAPATPPTPAPAAPGFLHYDSAPRSADARYMSHREGEYDEYPDFIPPAGGGMGAPVFAGM